MKKPLLIFTALVIYGCASLAPSTKPTLLHEKSEPSLITKQEFIDRATKSAILIYEAMRTISEAANQYALDNDGSLPTGDIQKSVKALLLEGGYLESWPTIPPFAFTDPVQLELKYANKYDDMDGIGTPDDVIYLQDVKIEVCKEFIRRYSSLGPDDVIYDFESNGRKYPGEVFGRHIKIYAINWSGDDYLEYCDIEWVMQYND